MNPGPSKEEQGVVAITVAISLMVFVALLAITIDIANVRAKRADAQAAADNAALAAAWRACKSEGDPPTAAESVAAANGFSGGVTVTSGGSDTWTVTIDTGVSTSFGNVLGVSFLNTTVKAKAGASCSPGSTAMPAMHASGECDDPYKAYKNNGNDTVITGDVYSGKHIDWSGARSWVYGNMHAEHNLKFGGDDNTITDQDSPETAETESGGGHVTYGGVLEEWKPSNTYVSLTHQPGTVPRPADWASADFLPGGAAWSVADSDGAYFEVTGASVPAPGGVIAKGLYVKTTSGDLVIPDGATSAPGGVTIVTTHPDVALLVSGDNVRLQPYFESLLFASFRGVVGDGACGDKGIDISGNDHRLNGVLYAPNSEISFAGESNHTVGALIARGIQFSGNFNKVTATQGSSAPTQFIEILE